MKKRIYEKPATKVVQVQQSLQMLQASSNSVQATMNDTWVEEDI